MPERPKEGRESHTNATLAMRAFLEFKMHFAAQLVQGFLFLYFSSLFYCCRLLSLSSGQDHTNGITIKGGSGHSLKYSAAHSAVIYSVQCRVVLVGNSTFQWSFSGPLEVSAA